MNKKTEFGFYGVRGSFPISDKKFMEFGGNTSAYTLRTPENSLIFLDAGNGLKKASNELDKTANNVYMVISHLHFDHTIGLLDSKLPWMTFNPEYKGKKITVFGPEGVKEGLQQIYDGKKVCPVAFVESSNSSPTMPSFDSNKVIEAEENKDYIIDNSTIMTMMKGNHPVEGGVNLYRFDIKKDSGIKRIVYATDNEFDYLSQAKPNPNAEQLKKDYSEFIENADLLVADGQFTIDDYLTPEPVDVRGFGHSFTEQIAELASKSNVANLVITHHGYYNDRKMKKRQENLDALIREKYSNLNAKFAKKGDKIEV